VERDYRADTRAITARCKEAGFVGTELNVVTVEEVGRSGACPGQNKITYAVRPAATRRQTIRHLEHLAASPWDAVRFEIPERVREVPAMLTWNEKRMLYWVTTYNYTGGGKICDLGAFLGGSTVCFAAGLRDAGRSGKLICSYDLFTAGPFEQQWMKEWMSKYGVEPPPDEATFALYSHYIRGYEDLISVRVGDILRQTWDGLPIEILFVDIAKTPAAWDHVVREFFPSLIPGESIVILQDYNFEHTGPWHQVVMEKLHDHFAYLVHTPTNAVVFLHTHRFEGDVLDRAMWSAIPDSDKRHLMEGAIDRVPADIGSALRPVQARLASMLEAE
jgi:hypothetical protein